MGFRAPAYHENRPNRLVGRLHYSLRLPPSAHFRRRHQRVRLFTLLPSTAVLVGNRDFRSRSGRRSIQNPPYPASKVLNRRGIQAKIALHALVVHVLVRRRCVSAGQPVKLDDGPFDVIQVRVDVQSALGQADGSVYSSSVGVRIDSPLDHLEVACVEVVADWPRPLLVCEIEGEATDIGFGQTFGVIRVARVPSDSMRRRTIWLRLSTSSGSSQRMSGSWCK